VTHHVAIILLVKWGWGIGYLMRKSSGARAKRRDSERFRRFAYADLVARDKVNLDIFWLKDDALDDPDLLPPPEEVAAEIVENLETALERFRRVANALSRS
jgi:type I restriction enzyme M protein